MSLDRFASPHRKCRRRRRHQRNGIPPRDRRTIHACDPNRVGTARAWSDSADRTNAPGALFVRESPAASPRSPSTTATPVSGDTTSTAHHPPAIARPAPSAADHPSVGHAQESASPTPSFLRGTTVEAASKTPGRVRMPRRPIDVPPRPLVARFGNARFGPRARAGEAGAPGGRPAKGSPDAAGRWAARYSSAQGGSPARGGENSGGRGDLHRLSRGMACPGGWYTLGSRLSALGSRLSASRLSALGSRLSALGSRLSALGSRLSALGSRLSALGSRLSALGSRLSALGSRLSALGSRLSALGSRLSALGSRLSALGSRLSALGSRLSALGSRLSALGSRLSALGSRLSALGSRLSALLIASSDFTPDAPSCGVHTAARDCAAAGARPSTSCRSMRIDVRPFGESEGSIFDPHVHIINRNIRKSPSHRGRFGPGHGGEMVSECRP